MTPYKPAMDHHLLTLNEAREATNLKIWKKLMENQEQTTLVKRMPASFPDQIERGSRDSRRYKLALVLRLICMCDVIINCPSVERNC